MKLQRTIVIFLVSTFTVFFFLAYLFYSINQRTISHFLDNNMVARVDFSRDWKQIDISEIGIELIIPQDWKYNPAPSTALVSTSHN